MLLFTVLVLLLAACTVTDDFNRADGGLGPKWAAMADGPMAISGQVVVGTKPNAYSGSIRIGEGYANDQSSALQLTGVQLSGGQWIGVGVRAQNGGQDLYLGLYWWNGGAPVLMLFERNNGNWAQLGATYPSGPLAAGTRLQLSVVGSSLTFSQDGVARIVVTDTTLTSGAPAIMAFDTPSADNWEGTSITSSARYTVGGTVSGLTGSVVLSDNGVDALTVAANGTFTFATALASGAAYNVTVGTNPTGQTCTVANASGTIANANITNVTVTCTTNGNGGGNIQVQYVSTDANGVQTFNVTSPDDGGNTPQAMRILNPTHPAAGVAHNFIYTLPVEPGIGDTFGDGLDTLQALDAQDQYNLTIIEPSFPINPWYANNPNDTTLQFDTFMANDLQPWVTANLSTTGTEQHWLIGFSKSGIGAQDLLLRHPDRFTLAASWDFPADMSTYDQFGDNSADNYGTDPNFQMNYRLSQAFLDGHKAPFLTNKRIWIGGYNIFQQDISDYDALLTTEGIKQTMGPMQPVAHLWNSGWVAAALAGLAQDSIALH